MDEGRWACHEVAYVVRLEKMSTKGLWSLRSSLYDQFFLLANCSLIFELFIILNLIFTFLYVHYFLFRILC